MEDSVGPRFAGKSILVTGGASGIGRAAAILFAREGGRVLVVDQHGDAAGSTVDAITNSGGTAVALAGDVSTAADCRAMVEQAVERFGRLDVAFNNAGIGSSGQLTVDEEETVWDRLMAVNLKSVFLCMSSTAK
jgi:NAD(P)-dependent dehydrogenase (short-subunit alcohol dehydrogenase family)